MGSIEMTEDILTAVNEDIKIAAEQLAAAKTIIEKLRAAGEDTAELERKFRVAEARLRRFKTAFK